MSSSKIEPIAVIGLAVRLRQEAKSPEAFQKVMGQGHSARAEVPESRLNFRSHKIRASGAHFVEEDIAAFDAPFFTISPSDAETMDNMQRWLLETTFEALENAGLSLDSVAGSKTSVHIGVFSREYEEVVRHDPLDSKPNQSFRTLTTILANRISRFYDFKGPSVTVDTARLGSLHTIHMACDGLRNGDADIAIVGGCNLIYNPNSMSRVGEMGLLSPDGISYNFDHRANGYSRGEGFCIVVLKRAGAATRDGNTLRAVIRASGINTSGRPAVTTQPSSSAQEILIQSTYQKAGLHMSLTRYFEAHGTGTSIGDPLEASAIHATFEKYRDSENPPIFGAVESTIGHLEHAVGIAGLIKDVLAVEKGIIPPNIWFEKANPKIPCEAWKFKFPTKPIAWPRTGIRRASINSFGLGGANAHVVLDDALSFLEEANLQGNHRSTKYPSLESGEVATIISSNPYESESPMRLFVLSAADAEGVGRLCRAYKAHLVDQSTAQTSVRNGLDWPGFKG